MASQNFVQLGYDLYLSSDLACAVECVRRPDPDEINDAALIERFPPRTKIKAVIVLRSGHKYATTLNPLGAVTRFGFARQRKTRLPKISEPASAGRPKGE